MNSSNSIIEDGRVVFEPYNAVFLPYKGCLNSSIYTQPQIILIAIAGGLSTFLISFLNILIYVAFAINKKLRKLPCATIIWHVMVPSDLLIGAVAFPLLTMWEICGEKWPLPKWTCDVWMMADYLGCNVSKYSVALISIERFIAVNFPIKHRTICSPNNLWWAGVAVWVVCGLWLTGEIVVWPYAIGFRDVEPNHYCDHPLYYDATVNIIHRILAWYIPFTLTVVFYSGIAIFVLKHTIRTRKTFQNNAKTENETVKKTFKVTTIVIVSFALCWFPYQIIEVLKVLKKMNSDAKIFARFSFFLSFENSLVNPVSYFFMDSRFRTAVFGLMYCTSRSGGNQIWPASSVERS